MHLKGRQWLDFVQVLNGFLPHLLPLICAVEDILVQCNAVLISKFLNFLLQESRVFCWVGPYIIYVSPNVLGRAGNFGKLGLLHYYS